MEDWSGDKYVEYLKEHRPKVNRQKDEFEVDIEARFPLLIGYNHVVYASAFVEVDNKDNILLWYLPAVLLQSQRVSNFHCLNVFKDFSDTILKQYFTLPHIFL